MKTYAKVVFITLSLLNYCNAAQAAEVKIAEATGVIFENVRIFNGSSDQLSPPSNVLVAGNAVKSISADAIADPDGMKVTRIQGGGRTLMPGLIDNHVHLFMTGSSAMALRDPKISFETLNATTLAEAEKMLLRGFTAVRDVGGPVFDAKNSIDSGKSLGPRIYPSGGSISQTSGHGDTRLPNERAHRFGGEFTRSEIFGAVFIADGRDEVLTATRENLRAGASQIKVMAGGGAASPYDPLDVTQYTLDELKAAVEAADDWGTYVTVHAYTPKAVRRAIEAGVKCIEHGQLLDEPTMQLLGEKDIWLSLQALDEAPPTAKPDVIAKKHSVVEGTNNAFKWAKQLKVKLAWGTDLVLNSSQMTKQNTDIIKLKAWFTPAEALKLVTHDNAELLALSGPRNPYPGKQGVVEAEALADLILVNGDPIANLELMGEPDKNFLVIMKDGKIYKNILNATPQFTAVSILKANK
jgi:imidazolonepropionase-like amidohydrolase